MGGVEGGGTVAVPENDHHDVVAEVALSLELWQRSERRGWHTHTHIHTQTYTYTQAITANNLDQCAIPAARRTA